jgi:hypothetical protein
MFRHSHRKFREHRVRGKLPAPRVYLPGVYGHCGTLSWEIQLAFEEGAAAKEWMIVCEQDRKPESTLRNPARLDIKPRLPS